MIGCQTRDGTRLEGKSSNQLKRSGQMEERSTELLWWGRGPQASGLTIGKVVTETIAFDPADSRNRVRCVTHWTGS